MGRSDSFRSDASGIQIPSAQIPAAQFPYAQFPASRIHVIVAFGNTASGILKPTHSTLAVFGIRRFGLLAPPTLMP